MPARIVSFFTVPYTLYIGLMRAFVRTGNLRGSMREIADSWVFLRISSFRVGFVGYPYYSTGTAACQEKNRNSTSFVGFHNPIGLVGVSFRLIAQCTAGLSERNGMGALVDYITFRKNSHVQKRNCDLRDSNRKALHRCGGVPFSLSKKSSESWAFSHLCGII